MLNVIMNDNMYTMNGVLDSSLLLTYTKGLF